MFIHTRLPQYIFSSSFPAILLAWRILIAIQGGEKVGVWGGGWLKSTSGIVGGWGKLEIAAGCRNEGWKKYNLRSGCFTHRCIYYSSLVFVTVFVRVWRRNVWPYSELFLSEMR